MQFSQALAWTERDQLIEAAQFAEEVGFDGVLLADHGSSRVRSARPIPTPPTTPDRPRVATPRHGLLDHLAVGLAGARRRVRPNPRRRPRVGDHPDGRF